MKDAAKHSLWHHPERMRRNNAFFFKVTNLSVTAFAGVLVLFGACSFCCAEGKLKISPGNQVPGVRAVRRGVCLDMCESGLSGQVFHGILSTESRAPV